MPGCSLRTLAVAAIAASMLGPTPAAAVTLVSACRDLDKAGETYILSGNIVANTPASVCFRLLADRVTLDLAGHTLMGLGRAADSAGISDMGQPRTSTVVKNGSIEEFGFGISLGRSTRSTVRGVTASDNLTGMIIGPNSLVKDCVAQRNLEYGIAARDGVQVEGCLLGGTGGNGNGAHGLLGDNHMLVTRNTAIGNVGHGITVLSDSTVTHNTATGNGIDGIQADQRSLVSHNTANDNGGDGIVVGARSTATFNTANNNGEDGIKAECPSTILNNEVVGNGGLPINTIGTGCVLNGNVTTGDPA